jgi:hypothetical protein
VFNVNLKANPPSRDGLVEQYLDAVYNVAEYHESNSGNLKLAYDYYSWLIAAGYSHAPRLKAPLLELIQTKAGRSLSKTDTPEFEYSLDYKEGRCLLLEFLRQQGVEVD